MKQIQIQYKSIFFFCISLIINNAYTQCSYLTTDLITYSYDRPMQLYAFLESLELNVTGIDNVYVIFRTSNTEYDIAYKVVQNHFPRVQFIQQKPPYNDLKALTIDCFCKSSNPYILFGVDDIIIKDTIDINLCCKALEQYNAHGFFFRLGTNLSYCFANSAEQPLPPLQHSANDIYSWHFDTGTNDWKYPNNLDFTLYRKADIKEAILNSNYKTPYSLESEFMVSADYTKKGLCHEKTKIINIPLNIVQSDWPNPSAHSYDVQTLLNTFNQGFKIDTQKLYRFENKSHHTPDESLIHFIQRDEISEKLIVIVTPSYNNKEWWLWNLKSSLNQNYHNYYIVITDDCSPDNTGQEIEQYIQENHLESKVILVKNSNRRGALHNLYTMIHNCPSEAIVVAVDGDDALYNPMVLQHLNRTYTQYDIWLTYGQFIEYPSGSKGWCSPIPEHIIQSNTFRDYPDLPSHLRTFYAWLFKSIRTEDLLYNGEFYKMTWDYAMMFPMIEMAGERYICFTDQIMYIYNNENNISDHKISRQLQAHLAQVIRSKPSYTRLPSENNHGEEHNNHADIIIFAEEINSKILDQSLDSIYKHITGVGTIYILYIDEPSTNNEYLLLQEKYPQARFIAIDEDRASYKPVLSIIYNDFLEYSHVILTQANYLVTAPINISECIKTLEEHNAYNFCLGLFKKNSKTGQLLAPERMALLEIDNEILLWNYSIADGIWSCAANLNMCLYRKDNPTIQSILNDESAYVYSWKHFIGWWAQEGQLNKVGLCFKSSKTHLIQGNS